MLRRSHVLLLSLLLLTALADAKKKSPLPFYVLNARTVLVLIDPDAGTSPSAPLANKNAQQDVEKAFLKWGRLTPVLTTETADLIVTVRKGSGKIAQATIGGLPTNDRPVIGETTDDTIRVAAQQGRPPNSVPSGAQDTTPHPQAEAGQPDDMFTVYQGHIDHPLDHPAVWRYTSSDALHSPDVPAVDKFRKAVEDSDKQQKSKP